MAEYTVKGGNIIEEDVEVIVNAWNRNILPWWLLFPQGVSGAIKKVAGYKPFQELAKLGSIPLGEAVLTSSGKLTQYKGIIHVAGINMFWSSTKYSISNSIINAIKLAEEHNCKSIAFPVIGSGSGGGDKKKSLDLVLKTLKDIDTSILITVVIYNGNKIDKNKLCSY